MAHAIGWVTGTTPTVLGKPSPALAETLVGRFGIDPSEIAVVGDSAAEIDLARAMGAGSVLILSGAIDEAALAALPDDRRPDVVAADVAELFHFLTVPKHSETGFCSVGGPERVGSPGCPRSSARSVARIVSVPRCRVGGFPRSFGYRGRSGRSDARPHRCGVVGAVASVANSVPEGAPSDRHGCCVVTGGLWVGCGQRLVPVLRAPFRGVGGVDRDHGDPGSGGHREQPGAESGGGHAGDELPQPAVSAVFFAGLGVGEVEVFDRNRMHVVTVRPVQQAGKCLANLGVTMLGGAVKLVAENAWSAEGVARTGTSRTSNGRPKWKASSPPWTPSPSRHSANTTPSKW